MKDLPVKVVVAGIVNNKTINTGFYSREEAEGYKQGLEDGCSLSNCSCQVMCLTRSQYDSFLKVHGLQTMTPEDGFTHPSPQEEK
jgi:hypothetical protein